MSLFTHIKKYTDFYIEGKRVLIPYCIVENSSQTKPRHYAVTTRDNHFAGKGTAAEIYGAVRSAAEKADFNLVIATSTQIRAFMLSQGIGVDCSGFAYNVIDAYLKASGQLGLDTRIQRFPGVVGVLEKHVLSKKRVRRSSADTLTNELNTYPVNTVRELKVGDLVRLTPLDWRGKHVLVIVRITSTHIFYAHSSANTKIDGPHISAIRIIDVKKNLDQQEWLELTKDGKNYGKETLIIKNGDGARRFKFWEYSLQ